MHTRTGNRTQGRQTLCGPCPPEAQAALRSHRARLIPCLFAMVLAGGCASTKVANRQQLVSGPLPRPNVVWVYDFAASAADVPGGSALAGQVTDASQTPEELATGRQLGAEIASQLVEQIQDMGMPAAVAGAATMPQINDIVIRGYLVSVHEGSAAERMAIGFGAGASALKTAVEGFQMTAQGLRKLGSGDIDAGGGKSPGAALGVVGLLATANPAGLIVSGGMKIYGEASGSSKVEGRAKATAEEIADVLKKRFQQQGWIN
jgi:hypothetical protein